jgi:hypothetical protein
VLEIVRRCGTTWLHRVLDVEAEAAADLMPFWYRQLSGEVDSGKAGGTVRPNENAAGRHR